MTKYYYSDIEEPSGKFTKLKKEVFEWLDVAVISIISVVIALTLVFRVVNITGSSMENTLYSGQKIIISNLLYRPRTGDIVVISRNVDNSSMERSEKPLIKRIIATEGQTVDIDFDLGIVYVNGLPQTEDYTKTLTNLKYDIKFPVTVPDNCVFVMGDNRNNSLDSRSSLIGDNGMIDIRYILGKAILRIYPFNVAGEIS